MRLIGKCTASVARERTGVEKGVPTNKAEVALICTLQFGMDYISYRTIAWTEIRKAPKALLKE